MTRPEALQLVEQAMEEINSLREEGHTVAVEGETRLVGEDGVLDSMETVNLVVSLESSLTKKTGRKIELITPEVFTGNGRFFESVNSLVNHILNVCNPQDRAFAHDAQA